jgi:(E)-4-hydroxy-3-methylbut-2-enyl-diphosphate synthase
MCGNLGIGGDSPISIQSMTTTRTKDIAATVAQILELQHAGCDIVRVAIVDMADANAIPDIKKQINIPLVACIHFDHKLALACIKNGIDKIRINPGNIGSPEKIAQVVTAAKLARIPIRIGVNSGSIEHDILEKHGNPTADAMVESAMRHVKILTDLDFTDIVISIKSSCVTTTVDAYRKLSKLTNYPLHLGITHTGTKQIGTIKSAAGLGSLLLDGIGDTIRVTLADNPVQEIIVAKQLLQSLGLRRFGVEVIACPTCGRCKIDIITLATQIETALVNCTKPITVAVMGCGVNGPNEASHADIGIAGGDGEALLFKLGKPVKKIPEHEIVETLLKEIESL